MGPVGPEGCRAGSGPLRLQDYLAAQSVQSWEPQVGAEEVSPQGVIVHLLYHTQNLHLMVALPSGLFFCK